MRLFIGIEFPENIIEALAVVQATLRRNSERGGFKRRDNFHLTLKFLGEVPAADVPLLTPPLAALAAAGSPFTLTLGQLGQFGSTTPIRVVWADLSGDLQPLAGLQRQVEEAIIPLGFPPEQRPWRPHITLAQDVAPVKDAPPWTTYKVDRTPFAVNEFAIILSEESERRRIYTPIHRFPLSG